MNYDELEKKLWSSSTYSGMTDAELLDHFNKKFPSVPFNNDEMFIFHHNREFENRNHIISVHDRKSGRVPMHIFHYIVITYVYSGSFTITVEEEVVTVNEGDIIILDKHVPHSVAPTGENDLGVNIILNEQFFPNKFINRLPTNQLITTFIIEMMNHRHTHNHYLLYFTNNDMLLKNCIQNILCEYFDPRTCSDDIIDNYIMILISHLARESSYNTNFLANKTKNRELVNRIFDYINQNYQTGNLTDMCSRLGYNASYISKLIKQTSGKTYKQLVNEQRMKKALILLQNNELPIYEIAEQVGISNLTSFYKRFKDFTNCTPQEYRRRV
ncbi:helix-turn-helix domain-containing protein [Enterococcus hulanensis]|uniref:AraC family transcriptional regulator n=1 Tax=Enterococcus hulanensis TaxID=2559929 RepID=UPI001A8C1B68|nr:AraC family transcriptional regulator [Enterococcus hulanensis]MBO0458117.1 helix-turn-helix domain-containing protein [Enterococcus hulanensis]